MTIELDERQLTAAARIYDTPELALWATMGAGKTLTTLAAIDALLATDEIGLAIIAAPRAVVDAVWEGEAEKFGVQGVVPLSGSRKRKLELCAAPQMRVAVLGIDALAAKQRDPEAERRVFEPSEYLNALLQRAPLERIMFVVDESTKIKNPDSARAHVVRALPWGRVLLLTGTPMPKGAEDIYGQMRMLRSCAPVLGETLDRFEASWCTTRGGKNHLKLRNEAKFKEALGRWLCEMSGGVENEVPVRTEVIPVQWAANNRERYDKELEAAFTQTSQAAIGMAWVQLMCLCCGGHYDRDEEGNALGTWTETHSAKVDALQALLDKHSAEPVLVFVLFDFQRAQIQRIRPDAEFLSAANVKKVAPRWNAGEIPLLVAHPASAGHGLNLQKGGRVVIFVGAPHLELWLQARARIARRGQKSTVLEYMVLAEKSLESQYYDEILRRGVAQEKLWLATKIGEAREDARKEAERARAAKKAAEKAELQRRAAAFDWNEGAPPVTEATKLPDGDWALW